MDDEAVHSLDEAGKALEAAAPGEVVTLAEGTYEKAGPVFCGRGSAGAPVTLRAPTGGCVRIQSPVTLEGDYVTLEGLRFEGHGALKIMGRHCRVTRCSINDAQSPVWLAIEPGSRCCEVDHCCFENKTNNRILDGSAQLFRIRVENSHERHHVRRNCFRNIPKGKTDNGYECLQLITKGNSFDPKGEACGTIIEGNLFEDVDGEVEIISVKANGNLLTGNTFRRCAGALVLRHGHRNVVSCNAFFGEGKSGSGGVRLQGRDQVVVGNRFEDLTEFGVGMMDGTPDDLYVRAERARALNNSFVNCTQAFLVGINHPAHPNGDAPKDCIVADNVFGGATVPFHYVQCDEPVNWLWVGNRRQEA